MVRGSSARMRAIASLTSLSARSVIDLEAELDDRQRRTLRHRRRDVLDAVDAGDGILDLLGDLRLQLRRGRARLIHAHLHDRDVDVGKARDRQLLEAEVAERHQHHEQHQRRHRLADRPGRDVQVHWRASLTLPADVNTGRTRSPSRRNVPDFATTTSPSASPSRTSAMPPDASPSLTRRVAILPSTNDLHACAVRVVQDGGCGHRQPAAPRRFDEAARKCSDPQGRIVADEHAHPAEARAAIDFRRHEPHLARHDARARNLDLHGLACLDARQPRLDHLGIELDLARCHDAEHRVDGRQRGRGADARVAAADESVRGRADVGLAAPPGQLAALRFDLLALGV